MAETERKGLVARWLEGKERSEDYARSTLPTNRWALFWDILKGRFGRLMLVNLLVLLTCAPIIGILIWRFVAIGGQSLSGAFGAGMGSMSFFFIPDITGQAESLILQFDLVFFSLLIPAGVIAALGISGAAYIIRNLIWTEGVFVVNDFARGIARNFLNVMEAALVFTVVLFLARTMGNLADLWVAQNVPSAGWMIASKVVGYIFVAFFLLVCMWMVSLGVNYKQGPWALLRNAVVMTVGTFPQTVFFAALATWPIFLALFGGTNFFGVIGMILLLLIGFSYAILVWMDYSQWAFDRFVNPGLGVATGRGLYSAEKGGVTTGSPTPAADSEAMREYRRIIVSHGRSKLVSRPIKPLDEGVDPYQLPESFSREDLQKLRESREAVEEDVRAYEEEHRGDERYVEYNREFDERERAIRAEEEGAKKKKGKKRPQLIKRK